MKVISEVKDDYGNMVAISSEGVHLKLMNKSKGQWRQIMSREGNIITKFVPKQNIMRMDNSIGFCKKAIEMLVGTEEFTHLNLIVDGIGTWTMTFAEILEKGHEKHFKTQGFEEQLFLVLPNMPKGA